MKMMTSFSMRRVFEAGELFCPSVTVNIFVAINQNGTALLSSIEMHIRLSARSANRQTSTLVFTRLLLKIEV